MCITYTVAKMVNFKKIRVSVNNAVFRFETERVI